MSRKWVRMNVSKYVLHGFRGLPEIKCGEMNTGGGNTKARSGEGHEEEKRGGGDRPHARGWTWMMRGVGLGSGGADLAPRPGLGHAWIYTEPAEGWCD